jgi:hypothetical protein
MTRAVATAATQSGSDRCDKQWQERWQPLRHKAVATCMPHFFTTHSSTPLALDLHKARRRCTGRRLNSAVLAARRPLPEDVQARRRCTVHRQNSAETAVRRSARSPKRMHLEPRTTCRCDRCPCPQTLNSRKLLCWRPSYECLGVKLGQTNHNEGQGIQADDDDEYDDGYDDDGD